MWLLKQRNLQNTSVGNGDAGSVGHMQIEIK
jgi:hypothetical protein